MRSISPFEAHGGINPSELIALGLKPDRVLDFSVNSNPFGPSPQVIEAIARVKIANYPDRYCSALVDRLASLNNVTNEEILAGNGTSELIWLTIQANSKPGSRIGILEPVFGEYRRAAEALGRTVDETPANPPDYSPDVESIIEYISKTKPALFFICNPNNPTGNQLCKKDIQRIAEACGNHTLPVIDEAYRAFAGGGFFNPPPVDNAIVLRSMTKDFALAGIRLGYVIAPPELISRMSELQPTWSVNAFAQAAGEAALNSLTYYENTIKDLSSIRDVFFQDICTLTGKAVLSHTHFCLINTVLPAKQVRASLIREKILVRDATSFGLPHHIRISTQLPELNARLLESLDKFTPST